MERETGLGVITEEEQDEEGEVAALGVVDCPEENCYSNVMMIQPRKKKSRNKSSGKSKTPREQPPIPVADETVVLLTTNSVLPGTHDFFFLILRWEFSFGGEDTKWGKKKNIHGCAIENRALYYLYGWLPMTCCIERRMGIMALGRPWGISSLACFFFLLLTFVLSRNWTFSIFIPMNRKEKIENCYFFLKNDSRHEEMFLASHVRRSNPLASFCFFLLLILFQILIL